MYLEVEEYIIMLDNSERHWKEVVDENNWYSSKFHVSRCKVYMKEK